MPAATPQVVEKGDSGPHDDIPEDPAPVQLHPGSVDPKLLASLTPVTINVSWPKEWESRYVVCTRVSAGWNDGVGLDYQDSSFSLVAYVPADGKVDVVILDELGTLSTPIAVLGTFTMPWDIPPAAATVNLILLGRLGSDGSVEDVKFEVSFEQ